MKHDIFIDMWLKILLFAAPYQIPPFFPTHFLFKARNQRRTRVEPLRRARSFLALLAARYPKHSQPQSPWHGPLRPLLHVCSTGSHALRSVAFRYVSPEFGPIVKSGSRKESLGKIHSDDSPCNWCTVGLFIKEQNKFQLQKKCCNHFIIEQMGIRLHWKRDNHMENPQKR